MRAFATLLLPLVTAASDLPPLPPPPVHSPAEELATFRFAEPGWEIEPVAWEPMVEDPVALTFDGDGRLWVVEMRGFLPDLNRNGEKDPVGRVVVLRDRDRDGIMDTRTVFLDGLVLPRAIAVFPDGVLVAENKPLWWCRDEDGDLTCDARELVDPDYAADSVEHSANGLWVGIDNLVHNAKEGHRYRRQGTAWLREETEPRGQWGLCHDDYGRLHHNVNHSPLHADLILPDFLTRNPHHRPTAGLDLPLAADRRVFPVRPTPATNRGYLPETLDAAGRIREFTSACSPWIYRGTWFPEAYRGNAFVCEPAGHLVQRLLLSEDGLSRSAARAWSDREFLASTDERFRPVALAEGPDGGLYVADLYRGVIQDAPHMTPYLREHSKARSMDRPIHLGRIWRVRPSGIPSPPWIPLSELDTGGLVDSLTHASGLRRDLAQRRLVFGRRTDALPAVRTLLRHHPDDRVRLHALWTLDGLGDSDTETLRGAAEDPSPFVASAALRLLAERGLPFPDRDDGRPFVLLHRILWSGNVASPDGGWEGELGKNLHPVVGDALFRDAALSGLSGREASFLSWAWTSSDWATEEPGVEVFFEMLARAIMARRNGPEISSLLARLPDHAEGEDWRSRAVLAGIASHAPRLQRDPIRLASAPPDAARLAAWFEWPGHVVARSETGGARPLSPQEEARFAQGRQLYLTFCAGCHGPEGQGVSPSAPPLAGSDWVTGPEERLVRVLLHGLSGPITVNGERYEAPRILPMMPPLAGMDQDATAAVLTYLRRAWGHVAEPVAPQTVNRIRIETQGRLAPWTQKELDAATPLPRP